MFQFLQVDFIIIEKNGKHQFLTNILLKINEIEFGTALARFYRNRWQIETGYKVKKYASGAKHAQRTI